MDKPALQNVFISYASPDREWALRLADKLQQKGVDLWIDRQIDPGQRWSKALETEIRARAGIVLVVSPHTPGANYVEKELAYAHRFEKTIIPVVRNECEPWIWIENLQKIYFTDVYDEGLAKLLEYRIPPRPWWRHILVFLKRNRVHFYVIAAVLAVLVAYYFLMPSRTSLAVAGGDASGMAVRVHNGGGRPSTLTDNFELDFGKLPIETQKLVVKGPKMISGHDNVLIRLAPTTTVLTPKHHPDKPCFFYNGDEIKPLLANARVTLRGDVIESSGRRRNVIEIPATDIASFINGAFPYEVQRSEICP